MLWKAGAHSFWNRLGLLSKKIAIRCVHPLQCFHISEKKENNLFFFKKAVFYIFIFILFLFRKKK